ncbi:hypothetical protein EVAR_24192_1 [Eumeta japonica]|uniref:Uncharacterized protein n=1 Tax=Eumeta variegata TaxID=151549 RepID=A0A4C1W645_EUMVA|nr:hypothetical protein EVAR_24192_1 [Eumeta japonica]
MKSFTTYCRYFWNVASFTPCPRGLQPFLNLRRAEKKKPDHWIKDKTTALENTIKSHNYNIILFDKSRKYHEFNVGDAVCVQHDISSPRSWLKIGVTMATSSPERVAETHSIRDYKYLMRAVEIQIVRAEKNTHGRVQRHLCISFIGRGYYDPNRLNKTAEKSAAGGGQGAGGRRR